MIDLSKLTPAPWRVEHIYSNGCETCPRIIGVTNPGMPAEQHRWIAEFVGAPNLGFLSTIPNAEFCALARNAFDVMMRRGWSVVYHDLFGGGKWSVRDMPEEFASCGFQGAFDDPFTALVEAEAWYVASVEAKP